MSQLELNKGDNFILGIDVSASMQTQDCPNNTKRIDYLKETAIAFASEAEKWDEDGIDVVAFGANITTHKGVTAAKAGDIIGGLKAVEPQTRTAEAIQAAYDLHKKGGYAQTVFFLFTDGEPADRGAVMETIRKIAAEIKDEHEFAISVLTVGNIAPDLANFLKMLDDELNAKHDIVDVKKIEEVDFMAAFAGALHD